MGRSHATASTAEASWPRIAAGAAHEWRVQAPAECATALKQIFDQLLPTRMYEDLGFDSLIVDHFSPDSVNPAPQQSSDRLQQALSRSGSQRGESWSWAAGGPRRGRGDPALSQSYPHNQPLKFHEIFRPFMRNDALTSFAYLRPETWDEGS